MSVEQRVSIAALVGLVIGMTLALLAFKLGLV